MSPKQLVQLSDSTRLLAAFQLILLPIAWQSAAACSALMIFLLLKSKIVKVAAIRCDGADLPLRTGIFNDVQTIFSCS